MPGERPKTPDDVTVLNPRGRVPVGLIIDDSTCLVNLNRFAMPQFNTAFAGASEVYHRNWREWPVEIPDAFVRKFGEWCAEHGVKGKYSIVPYPACVGRLDRMLPGWTQQELQDSLNLVRTVMLPNWDIHPEMVTHTRVIDIRTGHPYPDHSLKFMENWDWTTGRSVDEIAGYEKGTKAIYTGAVNADRYLLTFIDAGHNAAAPYPAPVETITDPTSTRVASPLGPASPFGHYADAVWDTTRMNNILQHFATAFFDLHLKGERDKQAFFDVAPDGKDATWKGFKRGTAVGLVLEHTPPGPR